jgi:hypothetical protein
MSELLYQTLYIISGTMWTLVYIFIILRGLKDKTCGMPFIALAFNITWEVLYSTVFKDGNWMHQVTTSVWALLDVVILYTWFKYGRRNWPSRLPSRTFVPSSIFIVAIAGVIVYFAKRGLHDEIGAYMAFLQNLLMSVLFINMLLQRGNLFGQSIGIAVAKLLGTLSITIIFYIVHWKFITLMGGLIFTFDLLYLLMVLNQGRLVWPFRLKLRS